MEVEREGEGRDRWMGVGREEGPVCPKFIVMPPCASSAQQLQQWAGTSEGEDQDEHDEGSQRNGHQQHNTDEELF